jgi:hypothetical protein
MTIAFNHDHRVQFRFKTSDINNFNARMQELNAIRAWLDRLVEWQPEMYSLRIHSSGTIIDVWFLKEEHATWCALRWL